MEQETSQDGLMLGTGRKIPGVTLIVRMTLMHGTKFHLSARYYEWNLEMTFPKHSSCRTSALGRITQGSHITHYILLKVCRTSEIVSHSSCRTSAIVKYFCPLPWCKYWLFCERRPSCWMASNSRLASLHTCDYASWSMHLLSVHLWSSVVILFEIIIRFAINVKFLCLNLFSKSVQKSIKHRHDNIGESYKDYSWIQDFEAEFP